MADWFAENAPKSSVGGWFAENAPPHGNLPPGAFGVEKMMDQGAGRGGAMTEVMTPYGVLPAQNSSYFSKATGENIVGGAVNFAGGDRAKGAHRIISGAGMLAAPLALPAAFAAPLATAGGLVAGQVGAYGGNKAATAMGATPDQADLVGDLTGLAAGAAGAYGASKIRTPHPLEGILAKKMAEVPPGEQFTRGEVNDAAKARGVNLDVAQATDSKVAGALKKANQYSLTGQGAYEENTNSNLEALGNWADDVAGKYAEPTGGREALGAKAQNALRDDLASKKQAARMIFEALDKQQGGSTIDMTPIESIAQRVIAENGDYYAKHPELKPGKAWAIMKDLAARPEAKPATAPSGLLDASGNPIPGQPAVMAKVKTDNWSDLHTLRSDLLDFVRNNPDIVKGRSEAWIQQAVAEIDNALTNASSGLSPRGLAMFRQANKQWEGIKNTYDNPQNPLYHAIRTKAPSEIPGMLSTGAPELAAQARKVLGSVEGPFQRQFVENLLNSKDGTLDLKNLNSRLSRFPNDLLESMLGPDGAREMRMLGKVAKKVTADANPSGTAKVGQPFAEGAGLFANPIAGGAELAGQYGIAKGMNSPTVRDYLTMAGSRTGPPPAPSKGAIGAAMAAQFAARKNKAKK